MATLRFLTREVMENVALQESDPALFEQVIKYLETGEVPGVEDRLTRRRVRKVAERWKMCMSTLPMRGEVLELINLATSIAVRKVLVEMEAKLREQQSRPNQTKIGYVKRIKALWRQRFGRRASGTDQMPVS